MFRILLFLVSRPFHCKKLTVAKNLYYGPYSLAFTCGGDTSKLLYGNLFFRFEENLSSPPLHEHGAELAEITTSYKVHWKEPGPVNIFYQNFHFSPTISVVRISLPLSLL